MLLFSNLTKSYGITYRKNNTAIKNASRKYDEWELPDANTHNGWKWLCFPVLDHVNDGADVAEKLLHDIMFPLFKPDLDLVIWKPYGENKHVLQQSDFIMWQNSDHVFMSPQGYKFKMRGDSSYTLKISGFLQDPQTVIKLVGHRWENWIGYFIEESMYPEDAFAEVWDNLISIKTQFWSMTKVNGVRLGSNENYTLNYGDMVIVKCIHNCSFTWGNSNPVNPKLPKKTKYFVYEEKGDYIPVYADLDSNNLPDEIAVKVNGVCKGAAVPENSATAQINAYVQEDEGEEMEFEFYYEGRSEVGKAVSVYRIYNPETGNENVGRILISNKDKFYKVSFKRNDSAELPDEIFLTSYPNPVSFSSSGTDKVTVSYELPEEREIRLAVYNIKGQKVCTLFSGRAAAGTHQAVWNGKDDYGVSVAAGVYFYKLSAGKASEVRRMLLLK